MKLYKKLLLLSLSLVFGTYQISAMELGNLEEKKPIATSVVNTNLSEQQYLVTPGQKRRAVLSSLSGKRPEKPMLPTNEGEGLPQATIVSCTCSKFPTTKSDRTDKKDLFVVQNSGNQFQFSKEAIDKGVRNLKTPLLLFIAHTDCQVMSNAIRGLGQELGTPEAQNVIVDNLLIDRDDNDLYRGIIRNLHYQVEEACKEFAKEKDSRQLSVMGAVYDPVDGCGRGAGALIFINVNGNLNDIQIKEGGVLGARDLQVGNVLIGTGAMESFIIKK